MLLSPIAAMPHTEVSVPPAVVEAIAASLLYLDSDAAISSLLADSQRNPLFWQSGIVENGPCGEIHANKATQKLFPCPCSLPPPCVRTDPLGSLAQTLRPTRRDAPD
ncbi:MAG: hypothetical protein ACT4TC_26695 [Myxococcaceae bacterium]